MIGFLYSTNNPRTKHEKRLDKIWNSGKKRFKVSRFRCSYCDKIKKGQSYSVVDGGQSCIECDTYWGD